MKCSRCNVEKPDSEFIHNGELRKNCKKCNEERNQRYQRKKEGIFTSKEILSLRREDAVKRGNFVCCRCGEEKSLDDFTPDKTGRSKYGKIGFCKKCNSLTNKFSKIKKLYGISRDEFLGIMEEQEGKCDICRVEMEIFSEGSNKANTLCVDHCHKTGRFRGFICNNCNRAIGLMNDNKDIVLSAYNYLVAHVKSDELLENPEEDNQQPSMSLNDS